jgi:hypothetical protein
VPIYIDRALAARPLPRWSDGILTALARLDTESYRRFGGPFWRARPADKDALIADWAAEAQGDNSAFVHNVLLATLEGVLGDPIHGGNRDGAGWTAHGIRPDRFAPSEQRRP